MRLLTALTLGMLIAPLATAAEKQSSPFLGSTENFQKSDEGKKVRVQRPSSKKAVDYEKFIFDPVLIFQSENSVLPRLSDTELASTGKLFKKTAEDTFKNSVQLVSEPGPGVLRVRFAIRGLKPGRYYMDARGTHQIKEDTKIAAATFEMEAIDSLTGERVVALIQEINSAEMGKPKRDELETTITNAFTEWMQALKMVFLEKKSQSAMPK